MSSSWQSTSLEKKFRHVVKRYHLLRYKQYLYIYVVYIQYMVIHIIVYTIVTTIVHIVFPYKRYIKEQ